MKLMKFNINSRKHLVLKRIAQSLGIKDSDSFYSNGGTITLKGLIAILIVINEQDL